MTNSLTTSNSANSESWFKDNRNIAKLVIGGLIGGYLLYIGLPYFNSILTGLIEGTLKLTELLWTGGIFVLSFLTLTSKKTWRLVDYLMTIIAKILTGFIMDWDEFVIQEKEIDQAEEDAEKVLKHANALEGEYNKLSTEIKVNEKEMKESLAESKLAESEGNINMQNLKFNSYVRAKEFIEEITPLSTDIKFLADYCQKAYDESQYNIRDARETLNKEKLKYEAISRGESALKSAQKALLGDLGLSKDAQLARENMKKKISQKIGTIKGAIRVTSKIMEEKDLKDRAKLISAREELKLIDAGLIIPLETNSTFSQETVALKNLIK
jgi:hypothetical protein